MLLTCTFYEQITATEIDFRANSYKEMKERQETGLYPPKITMTVITSQLTDYAVSTKIWRLHQRQ